jgi:hypothetical protein
MIEQQAHIKRICGAATRFLAWRAGRQLQAIDPHALNDLAREAQEFARVMRRLRRRPHRAARALAPCAHSVRCSRNAELTA